MKKNLVTGLVIGLVMGIIGAANATLVGDIVEVNHFFPDLSTPNLSWQSRVVVDGTSDNMDVYYYYVNVDHDSIFVDFWGTAQWVPASFNGLVVRSLNDSSGNALQGVSIDTNLSGWSSARLSFGNDSISFNWQDLAFSPTSYLNASLNFGEQSAVPEPTTMMLLGLGLVGLAGVRRNLKK